jgi:hypothetical protein
MPDPSPSDDVIIIKGGSLEIHCGKNHMDCFGSPDPNGKYKHKNNDAHIAKVEVKDKSGATLFSQPFDSGHPPNIEITYK